MLKIRTLNAELAKVAAEELHENPKDYEYYIGTLKEWLQKQLKYKTRLDDEFLLAFLRSAKFSLEITKQKIENFYNYRDSMPDLFKNRDLAEPNVEDIMKSGSFVYLPEPASPTGPRVIMIILSRFNMEKYTLSDIFRVFFMASDVFLSQDDQAVVSGFNCIMDLRNMPSQLLYNLDYVYAAKLSAIVNKNILPARFKGFHHINVSPIFETILNIMKRTLNPKMRDRFHYHSDVKTLYSYIPQRILPKEYGGDQPSIEEIQSNVWKQMSEAGDIIKEDNQYGLTDYGRSTRKQNLFSDLEDSFGVGGSFRKLNID